MILFQNEQYFTTFAVNMDYGKNDFTFTDRG